MLLTVAVSLVSCGDFFFATTPAPGEDPTTGNPPSGTPGDGDGDGGTTGGNPSGGTTGGDTTGENPSDDPPGTEPEDPRAADYAYTPYLPSEMPSIRVQTASNTLNFATDIKYIDQKWQDEIQYEACTVSVGDCDTAYTISNASAQIKVRGNYTITFPKQPFRLKFTEKQGMLGMNDGQKYKSWVLLAEWKDSSMLFDATAYYLGNTILGSDGYYCTDYRFVNLYLNGTYWGVYLLAEQQQTGKGRVDIPEPETDTKEPYLGADIGYFIEYDGYYDKEPALEHFSIDYNNNAPFLDQNQNPVDTDFFRGYTIKSDIYSQAQNTYIQKYVNNTYTALHKTLFSDEIHVLDSNLNLCAGSLMGIRDKETAIRRLIDVQSLVDTYILNEICCDYDLHWSSFYMSVDLSNTGSKKLTFCAPWDFDTAFGAKKMFYNASTTQYSNLDSCPTGEGYYAGANRNPWLILLINEEWFMDEVKAKWAEIVKYKLPQKALEQMETVTTRYMSDMQANAAIQWPEKYRGQYTKGYVQQIGDPCPDSFKELVPRIANCKTQAQASAQLNMWLSTRFNYLNRECWGDGTNLFI